MSKGVIRRAAAVAFACAASWPWAPSFALSNAEQFNGELSSKAAVEIAIKNNPGLHAALLQETQAEYAVIAEEALYDPVLGANANVAHDRVPSLRGTDGTIISTRDTINLGVDLTKGFSTGTVVQASLSGARGVSASPPINNQGGENAIGPSYSILGQLTLVQPFLRGAWNTIGLASLRIARLNRTATALAAQQTASQTLHDVLIDYWELWYATEAERIDIASRDLVKRLQIQSDEQVKSGTLAPVDALPYATQVAQQDEVVDTAVTTVRQRALQLSLQIGLAERTGTELKAVDTPPEIVVADIEQSAVADALSTSYQLKQLQTQLQTADYQARIAGDALRPRLDLTASVSAQGLGNRRVPPAFDQFDHLDAVSAQVGLVFEAPLTDTRRSAQVESARLTVHIAERQIESLRQQIKTDIETTLALRNAAKRRLEFALVTEKVSQQQASGVRGKFEAGTALAIEVQQANDDYQRAQLTVQRARVDVVEAEIDLTHKRGKLLAAYADLLKSYRPTALILNDVSTPM